MEFEGKVECLGVAIDGWGEEEFSGGDVNRGADREPMDRGGGDDAAKGPGGGAGLGDEGLYVVAGLCEVEL